MKVKDKVAKHKEKKEDGFKRPKLKKAKQAVKEFVSKKKKLIMADQESSFKTKVKENGESSTKTVKKDLVKVKKVTEIKDVNTDNEIQEKKKRKKKKKKKRFSKRNKYLHLILPNLDQASATITPAKQTKSHNTGEKTVNSQLDSNTDTTHDAPHKKKRKRKHENETTETLTKKLKTDVEQSSNDNEVKKRKKKKKSNVTPISEETQETICEASTESVKKKRKKKRKRTDADDEDACELTAVKSVKGYHDLPGSEAASENADNQNENGWEQEQPKKKKKKRNESNPSSIVEQSMTLQDRMMEKLSASRFRYLNEQLYKMTGKAAYELFHNDPSAFEVYHNGFKNQVNKWPMNPLKVVISSIKSKPSSLVVADFGCGDATLARKVKNTVHSFDLVAVNENVVECDMSKVPLKSASVDVAVFCLSLMGTNIIDYLQEGHRVLKQGGILKIAEVESRFRNVDHFIKAVQKLGFTLLSKDLSHNMFVFFDFEKSGQFHRNRVSKLKLNPCLYKKR